MAIFFIIIFIISSGIHLYASYKDNKKLRAQSKVFLLPALIGWYIFAASPVIPIMVFALACSWIGDLCLIPSGFKWLAMGGVFFILSHLAFIKVYTPRIDFTKLPLAVIIIAAISYLAVTAMIYNGLRPHIKKLLLVPMALYLLVNGAMNCFAFYQMISYTSLPTIIVFFGAMLFFASDSINFYVRFSKKSLFKTHFPVMLTYLLAEFLIVYGVVLLH